MVEIFFFSELIRQDPNITENIVEKSSESLKVKMELRSLVFFGQPSAHPIVPQCRTAEIASNEQAPPFCMEDRIIYWRVGAFCFLFR